MIWADGLPLLLVFFLLKTNLIFILICLMCAAYFLIHVRVCLRLHLHLMWVLKPIPWVKFFVQEYIFSPVWVLCFKKNLVFWAKFFPHNLHEYVWLNVVSQVITITEIYTTYFKRKWLLVCIFNLDTHINLLPQVLQE